MTIKKVRRSSGIKVDRNSNYSSLKSRKSGRPTKNCRRRGKMQNRIQSACCAS